MGGGSPSSSSSSPSRSGTPGFDGNGACGALPKLYFAYGSNLSSTQMSRRCPSSHAVGLAVLRGWSWVINERGFANVVPSDALAQEMRLHQQKQNRGTDDTDDENQQQWRRMHNTCRIPEDPRSEAVYGVLYRLPHADERMLDLCEGVPFAYEKLLVDVEVVFASRAAAAAAAIAAIPADGPPQQQQPQPQPQQQETEEGNGEKEGAEPAAPPAVKHMVEALVYVDRRRILPSGPKEEYVARMNRGIAEAQETWGLPTNYVDKVMRPFIPGPW